ncbi:MAG: Smr/MutS family protein [Thermodesulfobacteriota bacterium]
MKERRFSYTFKSFRELYVILNRNFLPEERPEEMARIDPEQERLLFHKAMEGVKPLKDKPRIEPIPKRNIALKRFKEQEELEALNQLKALVKKGIGFRVEDTPEYIEGTGYHVHPEIAKRLHRGDFSIQAHLDLHGLIVKEAKETFDQFMKWATTHGKTGLLVTHGRGLSSPTDPVLKKKVEEWLTLGPWRKWVIAYSSARKCDGGAGATYVLLRQRPVSKKQKIGKRD